MIQIIIDEYPNGFSLAIFDNKSKFCRRETVTEKVEAFRLIDHWLLEEINKLENRNETTM